MVWFNELLKLTSDNEDSLYELMEYVADKKGTCPKTLFSWSGGKTKMAEKLSQIFNILNEEKVNKTGKPYTMYLDLFFGGGGSFFSISDDLLLANIKSVCFNDFNKLLLTVHETVRNDLDGLKSEYIRILKNQLLEPYGTVHLSEKHQLIVYEGMRAEFYKLQDVEDFGARCCILFIILTNFQFSGNTNIKDNKFIFGKECVYNAKGLLNMLSIPIRLNKFNELYNKFDIKFINGDAFDLLEKYKNNRKVLLNLDPPYVDEDRSKEITEKTELKGVGIAYDQDYFEHERVVKDYLNCTNFIYNNNIHPLWLKYEKDYNLQSAIHDRPNSNSNVKIGAKRKIVREIILYGNKAL
jgi:site-specific DNA-adenine methylase